LFITNNFFGGILESGIGIVLAFSEVDFLEQFARDILGVFLRGSVNDEFAQIGFNSIRVYVQSFVTSVFSPEINCDSD